MSGRPWKPWLVQGHGTEARARRHWRDGEKPLRAYCVPWGGSKNDAADKKDIAKWSETVAKNDAKHGRDSKDNPNNKPNGK